MNKLKQSSALLLIVSFIFSIFSFSAVAAGDSVTLTFKPRVLRDADFHEQGSGGGEVAIVADGNDHQDAPGEAASDLQYKLYKIDDNQVDQYIDFSSGQGVLKDGVDAGGLAAKYTVNVANGVGTVIIPEADYGHYYVEMEDTANQGRTSKPFVISVPATNGNREANKNVYIFPKVTLKKHKVKIKKLVNGLELDGPSQSLRIKKAKFVMKFKLQRKNANGQWQNCFGGQEFETNVSGNGTIDMPELISGEYRIAETAFEAINGNNRVNILNDTMFKTPNGQPGFFFEFKLDATNRGDDDKTVEVNNIMRPQISKSIVSNNIRYLAFGVKPGDDINYKLEVDKPYIEGQDTMNMDNFKRRLTDFYVDDSALLLSDLVTGYDINSDGSALSVKFVDDNGNETPLQRGRDYDLDGAQPHTKSFVVRFSQPGAPVSNELAQLIYDNRGSNKAHIEIDFKVKAKDQVLLNQFLKDLRAPNGQYDNNAVRNNFSVNDLQNSNELPLLDKLSIVNFARVHFDNIHATSNKVRSQFGIYNINKKDEKGNALSGAEFELLDENGLKYSDTKVMSDNDGHADFIVPIGKDIEFDYTTDYFYHSGIEGMGDDALLDSKLKDNFNVNSFRNPDRTRKYKVKETSAPAGYEVIGKTFDVTMDALVKSQDIKNYPSVQLPFTGGIGTILFTVVGILLIGSGAFLFINSRRKKSAE